MRFQYVFTLHGGFHQYFSFSVESEKEARKVAKQLAKDLDALRFQFVSKERD